MSRFNLGEHLLTASLAIAVGLLSSVAAFGGLAAIARPAGIDARLDSAEQKLKILQRSEKTAASGRIYASGTICHGEPGVAVEALRRRLMGAASASGANLQDSFVGPGVPGPNAPDLTPIVFTLQATGGHEALIRAIGELAHIQPEIFMERVELTSQITSMTLKMKGEVLCWTGA